LRPGLLIAPNAFGGTALIRALAGFPFAIPVPKSAALMQSVSVKDVAQTVGFLLKADAPVQVTWDLVHPDRMTFQEIVRAHRRWLGFKGDRIIPVPLVVARGVAGISDFLGYLGWRSSFRTTALKQLLSGVDGRPEDWMRTSGIAPRSLDQILAAQPAGLQDRWFARAFFLKPLGLALDVFLWGFSGVAVLTDSFHPPSVLDSENLIAVWSLILAFLLLVRSTVRPALIAAIITSLVFFLTPQGSFNNLAVIFMHLTLLALLDER
jgi:hypothetical protein